MDNINDKDTTISSDNKDDNESHTEKLLQQITQLKSESQQFSVQRAKMKELFVQKEEEEQKLREEKRLLERDLDETRCQVTILGIEWESERSRAQQELNSLQELLNETLEENSMKEDEVKQAKHKCESLEGELSQLKAELSERPLLAAPGAMLTTFAKKVASQLGAADSNSSHESLEESMRKAKEDAELLKSLLMPLEEEINVLKKKLRDTDSELRKYQQIVSQMQKNPTMVNGAPTGTSDPNVNTATEEADGAVSSITVLEGDTSNNADFSTARGTKGCEMCSNYEAQLVQVEAKTKQLEKQLLTLERYREELAKETVLRKQMEEKWNEKKELHKTQVSDLQDRLKTVEETLKTARQSYSKACSDISKQFDILTHERRDTQERLDRLQLENENLVGKYNAHSSELQSEAINLPDNVEVLQEMWLKQTEDLIKARIGQESNEDALQVLKNKYSSLQAKYEKSERQLNQHRSELDFREKVLEDEKHKLEKTNEKIARMKKEMENLKQELAKACGEKENLKESESELRKRLVSLQTGLENGEAVQKDFVLLSQNLQKELEHLRVQNHNLRWEYEDDVLECRGCEQPFKNLNKGKANCRHCGRVFCSSCLSHKILSGPSKRESKVCTVCHTLLDHHTPPYFSTEPPK